VHYYFLKLFSNNSLALNILFGKRISAKKAACKILMKSTTACSVSLSVLDISQWIPKAGRPEMKQNDGSECPLMKHSNDDDYVGWQCEKCNNIYATKNSLRKHRSIQHNPRGEKVNCCKCGRDISRNNIAKHKKLCDRSEKKRARYDN